MISTAIHPGLVPALAGTTHGTQTITLEAVTKTYSMGELNFQVLKGVNLEIHSGEMVTLMYPRGSGKTTLMQIVGLLDRPSSGAYQLRGRDVSALNENEPSERRNLEIGFVFQVFHLLSRQKPARERM